MCADAPTHDSEWLHEVKVVRQANKAGILIAKIGWQSGVHA